MASVISGLGSGIDMQAIVTQLMSAERAPETQMNSLKLQALATQSAWSTLTGQMTALQTAATALTGTGTGASTATSSDSTTITATAGTGAQLGVVPITVLKLATAQQLASGPLSSPTMLVGAGTAVVTAGLSTIGATHLAADSTTTAGGHSVRVTQASAAATMAGTAPPATTFAAGGNDLTVTLADGSTATATLGTYASSADVVTALQGALGSVATVSLVAGQVQISSRDQGSGATLSVTGGALSALGLTTASVPGKDATLSVDNGPGITVTHLDGPTSIALGSGLTLTAGGHLSLGSATTAVVRTTATSTLLDLAAGLSVSGSPASAAVFDTGDGSATPTRLSLTANGTGTAGALTIDSQGISVLDPTQLSTVVTAGDAQLVVAGSTVTRSSNTITDLLPGVTLGLVKPTATGAPPTSVGVSRDAGAMSTKVKALVDALNTLVQGVATQTAYNATTKTGGPLSGDGTARSIASSLLDITGATTGTGATTILSQLGIQTTREGTLTFDSSVLQSQLQKDPDGVANLLNSFGTSLSTYAKQSLDTNGVVTTASKGASSEIQRRQDQIDAFEVRMTTLQTSYSAKFAALDAALGTLKSQQSQLASQLSGLGGG